MYKIYLVVSLFIAGNIHLLDFKQLPETPNKSANAPMSSCNLCEGNIILNSQEQVNNFDCRSIVGKLVISGADIIDLSPLNGLQKVSGGLEITDNLLLSNLNGLENLRGLLSHLHIKNNAELTEISALKNMIPHINDLFIEDNAQLISLQGLEKVDTLLGLLIENNAKLLNLDALNHLNLVEQFIRIINNAQLENIQGLRNANLIQPSLGVFGLGYTIADNPQLSSVKGIKKIEGLLNRLHIINNDKLVDLDSLPLVIGRTFDLKINRNEQLLSLDGLQEMRLVEDVSIVGNPNLKNVKALANIIVLGSNPAQLKISNNNQLTSLEGIDEIRTVDISDFIITNNPQLQDCCALERLLKKNKVPLFRLELEGNDFTCNTRREIQRSCDDCLLVNTPCDDGNPNTTNDKEDGNCNCIGNLGILTSSPIILGKEKIFKLYPNPALNQIKFEFITPDPIEQILIYDLLGKVYNPLKINIEDRKGSLNIQHLAPGIYQLMIIAGGNVYLKAFVKY